ncbi:hypothetical protein [Salmonirosea aquatica]|uniref:Piwi domain-containing protein n=1 Tax=Salmonirosea aquatica TaxID=2654236 RepID=A0A7C9FML2_9BACT|nr:hypothetical protein [Cytophagaceae bacterium SJW1-29]
MKVSTQPTTENSFELLNLSDYKFDFKLVAVDIKRIEGLDGLYHRELKKAERQVSSRISGPACLFREGGRQYIAIPSDSSFDSFLLNSKPAPVRLAPGSEIRQVSFLDCDSQEFNIISKWLDFSIRQKLKRKGKIFEDSSGRFFVKNPSNNLGNGGVDLLPGFKFRLAPDGKEKLFLVLDSTHRYVDRNYLSHYAKERNVKSIEKDLLGKRPNLNYGTRFLYEMGDDWFPIEVFAFSDKTAGSELIIDPATGPRSMVSLYDYLLRVTKGHATCLADKISKSDPVAYFKYPGKEMELRSVPISLIRRMYGPGDRQVGKLHSATIKETDKRFQIIQSENLAKFQNLNFNGRPLEISQLPLDSNLPAFPLKDLQFGGGRIVNGLKIRNGQEILNADYSLDRKRSLLSVGVLKKDHIDSMQCLLVPQGTSFPKGLQSRFQSLFEAETKKLCQNFPSFRKVVFYQTDKESVTDIIDGIERNLSDSGVSSGYALAILPNWREDDPRIGAFHDFLKYKFKDSITFQCASGFKLNGFFENKGAGKYDFVDSDSRRKFNPYLFNLAMEYLKINECYPYALKDAPNYDMYIGIDVHQQSLAACFFYGKGEEIKIRHTHIARPPSKSRAEKLTESQIFELIYPVLRRQIPRYCPTPNSIVIVRDGKSHEGEWSALLRTVERLHTEGVIDNADLPCAVVDLHKQSQIPLRVGNRDSAHRNLGLPLAGTYRIMGRNQEQAFLFPTGYPFKIRGSAKPLHLTLVDYRGNMSFEKIIEDIFGQCLLAFSAPDRSNGLPISIKLLDDYLQPFGYAQGRIDKILSKELNKAEASESNVRVKFPRQNAFHRNRAEV